MRLAHSESLVIRQTALDVFGERAVVWLFGSRADDSKKGGDIDLYIELPLEEYTYAKKVKFWCELVKKIGDQKIDVVINKVGSSCFLPIYEVAKTKGVRL